MGREYQVDECEPASAMFPGAGMEVQYEPDHQRRERGQHKQGMTGAAMIGEIPHCIAQRDENIEVRQGAADGTPQQGAATNLPSGGGFANGCAQCELCYRVQCLYLKVDTL